MKRSESRRVVKGLVRSSMVLIVLLFSYSAANALIYDDFNDGVMDKWIVITGSGMFSEHDGRLYFDGASSSGTQRLVGTQLFSPDLRVGLEFYNFSSTNSSPPGVWEGAALLLTLGPVNNSVNMVIGHNVNGSFFQLMRIIDGVKESVYVAGTTLTEGMLALRYDGASVYGAYSAGIASPSWVPIGPPISAPSAWTSAVPLGVAGTTGATGVTTFQVDNVAYAVIPIPPAALLFAPALAGIAILRRRFRR
jgi:hypothetical protein